MFPGIPMTLNSTRKKTLNARKVVICNQGTYSSWPARLKFDFYIKRNVRMQKHGTYRVIMKRANIKTAYLLYAVA